MSDRPHKLKPRFPAVKETLELFEKRINAMLKDTGFEKDRRRVKYFKKMLKLRDRMQDLLQTYPQFVHEKEPHDPSTAAIPEKLMENLTKLAVPPKRLVKGALAQINRTIQAILEDHQFCKNKCKAVRVAELARYRRKICCRFSKYPKSPKPSITCFRFKPCAVKVVPIHAVPVAPKRQHPTIEIKSRILEIDFDDDTIDLALPSLLRVKNCLEFHNKLIDRLSHPYCTYKPQGEDKRKLDVVLEALKRRCDFLNGMKTEIECRKNIKQSSEPASDEKPTDVPGSFACKWKNFRPFTNFLELPSRKKFEESLWLQRRLLINLGNVEKIKPKVKAETSNQAGASNQVATSENNEVEERDIVEPKEKTSQGNPKKKRIRAFIQRVNNNICFIENVLASYPLPEKPSPCSGVKEEHYRFKPTEKKLIDPLGDEKTEALALPKLAVLKESGETYHRILNRFMKCTENRHALARPVTIDDEVKKSKRKVKPDYSKPRTIMSIKQRQNMLEDTKARHIKRAQRHLDNRTKRLEKMIQEQLNRLEIYQATRSKSKSIPSDFHHHRVCNAKQEVDSYPRYKMKTQHKSICNSKATKHRLMSSLEKYREWLKIKLADMKFKHEIEETHRNAKDEVSGSSVNIDENSTKGKWKKLKPHSARFLRNLELLEKVISEMKQAEDSHVKAHAKLNLGDNKEPKRGPIDKDHLIRMSDPTKLRLKATFESFRGMMSKAKQRRIELQLGLTAEELEKLDGKIVPVTRPQTKQVDAAAVLQQIEEKLTADVFEELIDRLLKKVPELIATRKEPVIMTSNVKALLDKAWNVLYTTNGKPKSELEIEQYRRLAGVAGGFVFNTMAESLNPIKTRRIKNVKPLKAAQRNQDLLYIAKSLMKSNDTKGNSHQSSTGNKFLVSVGAA